jgi:hypothetical protein
MGEHPDTNDRAATGADYYPARWVPIASYGRPAEAHIARQKLESEGIDTYLDNENLIATDWLLANATAGIKLMVREPDVVAAEAVIRCKGTPELAIEESETAGEDEGYCDEGWRCSKCHRTEIKLAPWSLFLVLLALALFGAPALLLGRTCRCKSCAYQWRQ